jgi:predicted nucleic acid-binding protein
MIVVSDSGPIIHLSMIGRTELIHHLFGQVLVPGAVYREVVEAGAGLPGSSELPAASWAIVAEPNPSTRLAKLLEGDLDPGEIAAILLALEREAGHLLVDDLAARQAATRLGLSVIGTLGILLAAKKRGLVDAVGPLVHALKQQGFWISSSLEAAVLRGAGEVAATTRE